MERNYVTVTVCIQFLVQAVQHIERHTATFGPPENN